MKKKNLKLPGHESAADLKKEVQRLLRLVVIKRDGGCILRNYQDEMINQYRECGPFRNDGEPVLQAEHLNSRANMISFADSRLVICLCMRHHFYYKKQYPAEYFRLVYKHIGEERTKLLEKVSKDHSPHKIDLKMCIIALKQELKSY